MVKNKKGFTLIELLIVIAIIAILAAVVYVALDPLSRFRSARDSKRWEEVGTILNAIKLDQVDNGGTYLTSIDALTTGNVYMIGTAIAGCDDQNANCDTDVSADDACVDITGLVTEGYLGEVPVSPNGDGAWTSSITGYTLTVNNNGTVTVRACESESGDEITLSR